MRIDGFDSARWRRSAGVIAAAAVAVLVFASPATAQVIGPDEPPPPAQCAVARLSEQAGWSMSIVTGADRTGRYVVGRGYPADPNGDFRRFVVMWFNGQLAPVAIPGEDQQLADVNAFGTAVGFSYDQTLSATAWTYEDGELSALPGLATGEAWAINDRGDIAGVDRAAGAAPVWWPAGGDPVALPLPAGALGGEARDVDEDGTVVGFYTDAEFVDRGVAWRPDGSIVELAPPVGLGPTSRAFGVRNGWAYGVTGGPEGFVALRWHLPSGQVRELPQFDITAQGVNRFGWLVGGDPAGRAVFVPDPAGAGTVLPGLTGTPSGLGDLATAVSDSARIIAGQATDAAGNLRAVRWLCST